jgi:hypothetical protein
MILQARVDAAQYMNYKALNIITLQVSWSDTIFEMPSNSDSKAQYTHPRKFTRSLKILALFFFVCSLTFKSLAVSLRTTRFNTQRF